VDQYACAASRLKGGCGQDCPPSKQTGGRIAQGAATDGSPSPLVNTTSSAAARSNSAGMLFRIRASIASGSSGVAAL